MFRRLLLGTALPLLPAALPLLPAVLHAQSVVQSGSVTPGHAAIWNSNGVVKDGGTAINGLLNTLGVTNNAGPGFCISSAAQSAAARNQLCFAATTNGGTKISSYIYGTATNPGIVFDINGSVQGFPTVTLPVVNNDFACFDGTTGNLKDCGGNISELTVANHAAAIGTGGIGFRAAAPGTAGLALVSAGASSDPAFGLLGLGGLPLGTAGYAIMGNGGSAPSYQGFLNSGTSAITRTWNAKASDIVSVADFGTNTAAIQAAVDTGKSLYFPCGSYTWVSTVMMATPASLFGAGQNCVAIDFSGLGNNDVLRITPTSIKAGMEISGLSFSYSDAVTAQGRDFINITTSGATNYIAFLNVHDTTVAGRISGVTAGIGRSALRIDNAGANVGGGVFDATFERNNWVSVSETVYLSQAGDSLWFKNNHLASTSSRGFFVDLIAGAGSFTSETNNITAKEGSHRIDSGAGCRIVGDLIEQTGTNTTGAIINIRGGLGAVNGCLVSPSQVQEPSALGGPISINVDNAANVIVGDIPLINRQAAGTHINLTANAVNTTVKMDNKCKIADVTAICTIVDAGSGTNRIPTVIGNGTTTTVLHGNSTGAPGVFGSVALADLATQATNTVLGNATSGAAVPTALAVGSCSTSASALIWTTNTGFGCNTAINAATLGGATFAAPGTIGGGTPGAASFTTVTSTVDALFQTDVAYNAAIFGRIYYNSATGLTLIGKTGGSLDMSFANQAGSVNLRLPTAGGVTLATTGTITAVLGTTVSTSKATGSLTNLGGFGNAGAIFTDTLSVITMASAATTSAVCYNTGTGLFTYNATVGTCTVSDERFKNMGAPIADALDKLLQIKGVSYTWKDPQYGTGPQIGVGAQTVERVFPELVATGSDGVKSVDYQRLTAPIIEALRELKYDNDNLRDDVNKLARRVQ